MYICLCNALTEHRVRVAALAGATRPSEIYRACGCTPKCGTCSTTVRRLVDEMTFEAPQAELLAAD